MEREDERFGPGRTALARIGLCYDLLFETPCIGEESVDRQEVDHSFQHYMCISRRGMCNTVK